MSSISFLTDLIAGTKSQEEEQLYYNVYHLVSEIVDEKFREQEQRKNELDVEIHSYLNGKIIDNETIKKAVIELIKDAINL